jgi:hypothetical protein
MAALCRKHFIDVDQVFRVGDVDVEYGREQLEGVLI